MLMVIEKMDEDGKFYYQIVIAIFNLLEIHEKSG